MSLNCDHATLLTMHAYAAFIARVMRPIVKLYDGLPVTDRYHIEDRELRPEPVPATTLYCEAISFESGWQRLHHARHMRVVYGR